MYPKEKKGAGLGQGVGHCLHEDSPTLLSHVGAGHGCSTTVLRIASFPLLQLLQQLGVWCLLEGWCYVHLLGLSSFFKAVCTGSRGHDRHLNDIQNQGVCDSKPQLLSHPRSASEGPEEVLLPLSKSKPLITSPRTAEPGSWNWAFSLVTWHSKPSKCNQVLCLNILS